MNGPTGDAVLAGNGDTMRLSIDNVRTAIKLVAIRGQLEQMTGIAPKLGKRALPPMDIEVHGWRIARMKQGRTRPTLPAYRRGS